MYSFEKLRQLIQKRKEEQFVKLQEEVRKMRDDIEAFLTRFFESTSSQARTNYNSLEMF